MSIDSVIGIKSKALPFDASVAAFQGHEAISEPYSFEIGILTNDKSWNHDDAVMARGTLEIGNDLVPYSYHGIFAAVELLHEHDGHMLYRAVLVPKLWQLTLTRHSNVWTDRSIPDIIKDVLEWSGLSTSDYELRLTKSYAPREFVAQYKEDNLSFISRWMERLGIFYFFEQTGEQEKLVLVDAKSFTKSSPNPKIPYVPGTTGPGMASAGFKAIRSRTNALPSTVELLDYNYLNPRLDVRATAPVATAGSIGEISRFGDDNFLTPDDGTPLAKVRAEELLARRKVVHGDGHIRHLYTGGILTLEDHPRPDLSDQTYLITNLRHEGTVAAAGTLARELLGVHTHDPYYCSVTAIPATVQFRARSAHPWPRVDGYESGTVDGPTGSPYAQLDSHGRYKVRIMFDESDLGGGKASAWVRMQQPYGGSPEGFHFPLIKGTEVLLWFMGGDPDRPVIAGVVPNLLNASPVTVNNNEVNIINTVNNNLIEIVDTQNQMSIRISCPIENTYLKLGFDPEFQIILNTDLNAHFYMGGLFLMDVKATATVNVDLDVTFNFKSNWICNIALDNNITIDGNMNLVVAGDVNWTIGGDWNVIIDGDVNWKVGGDVDVRVDGDEIIVVGGDQGIDVVGDVKVTIGGNQEVTISGTNKVKVLSDHQWNICGHKVTFGFANSTEIIVGIKNSVFIGGKLTLTIAALADIKLAKSLSLTMGSYLNLKLAEELNLTAGSYASLLLGGKLDLTIGASITVILGLKAALCAGFELKQAASGSIDLVPMKIIL